MRFQANLVLAAFAFFTVQARAQGQSPQTPNAPPNPSDAPTPASEPSPEVGAPNPPPTYTPNAPPEYGAPQVQGSYAPQGYYEPPPPPPPEERHGFQMPPWSIRVDPFNLLLDGRLGFELEAGVTSFMSVELVPIFVVNGKPPTLNFDEIGDSVRQGSNGLGPISGTTVDVGFWLSGHAMRGYVIRAMFQNYGYTYRIVDPSGSTIDSANHTDRVLMAMFGDHSRWGAFTIAGGIGLGVDLNRSEHCREPGDLPSDPLSSGCGDVRLVDESGNVFSVLGPFYPVVLDVRFSLGVTID